MSDNSYKWGEHTEALQEGAEPQDVAHGADEEIYDLRAEVARLTAREQSLVGLISEICSALKTLGAAQVNTQEIERRLQEVVGPPAGRG